MPIAALSPTASRAITSTVALSDAISVVKELVDNALDSKATNILIEIAANTLDAIQVKDNGSGVSVEDRLLLCKRGYTSKIRTLEDLAQLGGTFLGFRGEALSSIAALSQTTQITTRVDGETAGTQLQFDATGKLVSSCSASHGTGTTVRVVGFLKDVPVRRQTAIKESSRVLKGIKQLLFKYAFARPTVRFQVKVLKSKSDFKDNWSFVPCKDDANLALVASKIVGKEVAAQSRQEDIQSEDGQYHLDALVLDPGADLGRLATSDQYCSVDRRPLNSERGFVKDLNKTYKTYVRNALPDDISVPKRVFLVLKIRCPQGAYDVNIEPAKDEVMLEDSSKILDLFENLCKQVYGELSKMSATSSPTPQVKGTSRNPFELLLRQKSISKTIPQFVENIERPSVDQSDRNKPSQSLTEPICESDAHLENACSHLSEVEAIPSPTLTTIKPSAEADEDVEEDLMDAHITNPFTLAKLNTINRAASSKAVRLSAAGESDKSSSTSTSLPPVNHNNTVSRPRDDQSIRSTSLSPNRSHGYQNPGPPNRPWKRADHRDDEVEQSSEEEIQPARPERSQQPTLLDSWKQKISLPPTSLLQKSQSRPESNQTSENEADIVPGQSALASHPTRGLSPIKQKPFRTPTKGRSFSGEQLQLHSPYPTPAASSSPERQQSNPTYGPRLPGFSRPAVTSPNELDDIMEFEHRKRASVVRHRENSYPSTGSRKSKQSGRQSGSALTPQAAQRVEQQLDAREYAARFSDADIEREIPSQPQSASYTQNPRQDKFRNRLSDSEQQSLQISPSTKIGHIREDSGTPTVGVLGSKEDGNVSSMSPHDARAYLFRQRRSVSKDATTSRSISSKLPFETIYNTSATYALLACAQVDLVPEMTHLREGVEFTKEIDPYIISGATSKAFDDICTKGESLAIYEEDIERLLRGRIKQSR